MDRAVVTGAAGFVGSHLTDALLAGGNRVLGLDNLSTGRRANLSGARGDPAFSFRRIDLARVRSLPASDLYFHLASPASPVAYSRDPVGTLLVNAQGTRAVLEAARRSGGRVVLASTSEVYGDPQVHPQPESYWGNVNPTGPRSCYDEGKRFAEALASAYHRQYDVDVRIARIFNTYGPRMDPSDGRVVSNFVRQALRREPLTIHGSGRQTRSFCYISDLVRGLTKLSEVSTSPEPVNLGNPRETSVLELARLVSSIAGVPVRRIRLALPPDDPHRRRPTIGRARRLLGWAPEISLEEGLRRTLDAMAIEVRPRGSDR